MPRGRKNRKRSKLTFGCKSRNCASGSPSTEELEDESEGRGSFKPDFKTRKAEEAVAAAPVASSSADEDDAYKYFQALAES